MRAASIALSVAVLLSGCAANISPQAYSVGSVGQVNRSVAGIIVSVRDVDISGTANTGSAAGGAAGAVAGSSLGGNSRGNLIGAIGGAVAGSLAGAAIERNSTQQKGREYVVETENGNLMTIVQGAEPALPSGQRVLVLYGSPARIIADPRVK